MLKKTQVYSLFFAVSGCDKTIINTSKYIFYLLQSITMITFSDFSPKGKGAIDQEIVFRKALDKISPYRHQDIVALKNTLLVVRCVRT